MAKRSKYKARTNPGAITTAHNDKLLSELREILVHEADKGASFTDSQLADMLLDVGLLTNKGQIYNIRLANDIPNNRERKILNFARKHNRKN